MCSRLSPSRSSSGYKSQSQRSDATISPSPSPSPVPATMTCSHTQVSSQDLVSPESSGGQTVMWAITSLSSVPPGSIIINPQTNQPYTNPDGSIYRYDPDNPPKFFAMENENGNAALSANKQQQQQYTELPSEPSRTTNGNLKNDSRKQRSPQSRINVTSGAQVTNSATSPSLPFTPPPPPPPPPPANSAAQNPPIPQQQQQQVQQQQPQPQPQPPPPPPPPQPQQQPQVQPQQQSLVKSSTTLPMFSHTNQTAQQPYATYVPTSEPYNQGVYPPPMGQPTVMMAPHPTQGQASMQNGGQGDVFNQNHVYTNYAVPVHQGQIPQSGVSVSEK